MIPTPLIATDESTLESGGTKAEVGPSNGARHWQI